MEGKEDVEGWDIGLFSIDSRCSTKNKAQPDVLDPPNTTALNFGH